MLAALLFIVAGGCAPFGERWAAEDFVWMDDGWVYAVESRVDDNARLVRFAEGAEREVVAVDYPGCRGLRVDAITRADAGVLVAAIGCADLVGVDVLAYRVADWTWTRLAHVEGGSIGALAWSADLAVGYLASAGGRCQAVVRVQDGAVAPFTRPIEVDGRTWLMDVAFSQVDGCEGRGDVEAPVIARSSLYVAASGEAAGSADRDAASGSVLRIPVPDGEGSVVAEGFRSVRAMAASPDGRFLVLSGERGGVRSCWLVDASSGDVRDLHLPWSMSVAVAPTADRLVVQPYGEVGEAPIFSAIDF